MYVCVCVCVCVCVRARASFIECTLLSSDRANYQADFVCVCACVCVCISMPAASKAEHLSSLSGIKTNKIWINKLMSEVPEPKK